MLSNRLVILLLVAMALCLLLPVPALAGDVEIDLNSADGSTDFELRDSGGVIQFDVDSDGNTTWPQGADDSDLTVPTYAGNPDTVITAPEGSVAYDSSGNTLYVNTDGATNWEALADGGGGGSAVVAGGNTQIQYNAAGSFGADAGFAYNAATDTLTAVNATFTAINNATIGGATSADATFTAINVTPGNVGIGTATPGASLEVTGSIWQEASAGISNYLRTNEGELASSANLNPGITVFGGDTNTGLYGMDLGFNGGAYRTRIFSAAGSGADISFAMVGLNPTVHSDFSEKMVIKNGGNVGIGVIAPEHALHIAGTLTATDATFETINNAQIGNSAARDATFTDITVTGSINGTVGSSSAGDGTFTAINVTPGNVGIGTTSPAGKLHVVETLAGAETLPLRLHSDSSTASTAVGVVFTASPTDTYDSAKIVANRSTYGDGKADLHFAVQDGGGANTKMSILSNGNVGIGVTDPDTKLEVIGGVTAVDGTFSGRVGIGTTTPSQQLAIKSAGAASMAIETTDDNSDTALHMIGTNAGTGFPYIQFYNGYYMRIREYGAGIHISRTNGSWADVFTAGFNGNIGIGVTDPDTKLEIIGGVTAVDGTFSGRVGIGTATPLADFHVEGTNATGDEMLVYLAKGSYGSTRLHEYYTSGTDWGFRLVSGDAGTPVMMQVNNDVGGSTHGVHFPNGNVGIGTTTPGAVLNVVGTTRVEATSVPTLQLKRAGNVIANGNIEWLGSDDVVDFDIRANFEGGSQNLNIREGTTSRMYIKDGCVGIGITDPGGLLSVAGSIIARETDNGNDAVRLGAGAGSGSISVYEGGTAKILLDPTSSQSYFNNGNVGIGVTDPDQKLEINSVFKSVPTDAPGTCNAGAEGSMYYDSSASMPCFCNGTNWVQMDDASTVC